MDRRLVTILMLFDFSKAFDAVPHHSLLIKLRYLGFSAEVLKWIASYLTDRSQSVVSANGELSGWREANTGVPQVRSWPSFFICIR